MRAYENVAAQARSKEQISPAEKLMALFAGLDRAHGAYEPDTANLKPRKKVGGKAKTLAEPVTVELWKMHLDGELGLGIIPIRDDGSVMWCAIDVDAYDQNTAVEMAKKVAALGLRMTVFRSKSGGAHIVAFFREPVAASRAIYAMGKIVTALGLDPKTEVFPKQTKLEPDQYGNWLNMPYFNHEYANLRVALDDKGQQLSLEQFLETVERTTLDDLTLSDPAVTEPFQEAEYDAPLAKDDPYPDGPPCLARMLEEGEPRNIACHQFAVYAKLKHGDDDYKDRVIEFNQRFDRPLPERELNNTVLKSGDRKDYGYRCPHKDRTEMAPFCNKAECSRREFGINGKAAEAEREDNDAICDEYNQRYAVVKRGNKVAICEPYQATMTEGDRRTQYRFLTVADTRNFESNNLVMRGRRELPKFDIWLKHPRRRTFAEMILDPELPCGDLGDGRFNMWTGFAVKPKERDNGIPYFEELVNEIICDGDSVASAFVWNWMARGIQQPGDRAGTGIAMRGGQGTGKGSLATTYGRLFGQHWYHAASIEDLTGQFSGHMMDVLFVFADEVLRPKAERENSKVKAMITEKKIGVESKYVDRIQMPNRRKFMFASNAEQIAAVEKDDRRLMVVDVSDRRKQDTKWFGRFNDELNDGGMEHLLWLLLGRDITDFDHFSPPATKAKDEQKDMSLDAFDAFWLDELMAGHHGPWDWQDVPTEVLYDLYQRHRRSRPQRPGPDSQNIFGRRLKEVIPDDWHKTLRKRPRTYEWPTGAQTSGPYYHLPPLALCCREFEKVQGRRFEWPDESPDRWGLMLTDDDIAAY